MNAILAAVDAVAERSDVTGLGIREGASLVILTPRYRTSRHVVGLLIPKGAAEPEFVVKVPRLRGDAEGVAREAAVLTALRETCPNASEVAPRVVAFADGDRPLLVETALAGPLVTPARLRAAPSRCVDAVVGWLVGLSEPGRNGGELCYRRLLEEPLASLADSFPPGAPERKLVERTLELVEPLCAWELPRVFEHGDLSHPNLILLEDGRVGVVDWELAEVEGLPLHDLAFFLTYATFALRRPRTAEEHVRAFHDAFFGSGGWSTTRVLAYAEVLGLAAPLLTPLFVACWARYTARLAQRIAGRRAGLSEQGGAWMRENRYYALWRHTIAHADELAWER